jgi:acyl-[acyl-carrier-protein]-phospholipid O-acyltransferase/long-chain-fatty-acid--[acyl-carrier-protein] ligase
MVPKTIRVVSKLPVLGTGKTDYVTLGALALEE